ncbi:WD repeat-containing protein 90 [Protopterus annectens]|uniref:WD repeat-containing protein 90 n=1 Tax=Protopterus annectens TaxID=7888 RepID=UPI001CFC004F|nr:WD repeat-containing protein 90 [Protopterus annectens]
MARVWQHPYVNIFKHFKIEEWKKSTKEGDVTTMMDKTIKCTVYRIRGSIPASNYIQIPKVSSQSLGLTGRYLYLLFKPIPSKYFVVHMDVTTEDSQVIRLSFSNLFKEFKSTATWLQFPFICGAAKGSVYEMTAKTAKQDLVGPAPASVRWTCLMMDLHYILSIYLNRRYSHLKSVRICSNLLVKNLLTSDLLFDPGMSFSEAKHSGVLFHGTAPMPRDMTFPVPKGESWHDLYDYIRFPSDGSKMPYDSIQKGDPTTNFKTVLQKPSSPVRELPRTVNVSKPVQDRVSLIQQITTPKPRPCPDLLVTRSIPEVQLTTSLPLRESYRNSEEDGTEHVETGSADVMTADDGGIHVYAHRNNIDVTVHRHSSEDIDETVFTKVSRPAKLMVKKGSDHKSIQPDPILKLKNIIGFGGCTYKSALWTKTHSAVVYPCHAIIVSMDTETGEQRFFIGHTDKISALAFNGSGTLLTSAQTGNTGMVRIWNFQKGSCLAVFKTHVHSVSCLSFSNSGKVLCGVGKDGHGKNMVVVWNTSEVKRSGEVMVMAKAHTDVDIQVLKIAFFDDTRMVSCGRDNIRLWRVRSGSLRSCPVNLGDYHAMEFTDVAFEEGHIPDQDPEDRTLFACSKAGHILEVDYKNVVIKNVRRLLPSQVTHSQRREKQTFNSGTGIAINSISISSAFCATGSEDGCLRLWPLDFSAVFLEAEHEGPVSLVNISPDGLKVLAATFTGNIGYLDIASRDYTTLMRSHTDTVLGFSVDQFRRHLATVSQDGTIRIWALDSLQQLYDFVASDEIPCAVAFHPSQQIFACGFSSGVVRVFSILHSSLLAEHKQHRGQVIGLVFSPNADYMYSAGSLGSLALYNALEDDHHALRVLGNVVARGSERGPDALTVSSDGHYLAFVGPSEYIVTIMDGRSLDELLRVDVSILDLDSTKPDSAAKVCFAPTAVGQILVTTSSNKILWLNTKTGRLVREISKVHKKMCSSLAVSEDAQFLLTAADMVIKVWDYDMKLDKNFQVYIGHSELVQQVSFTPDHLNVISVGDGVFIWDFLADVKPVQSTSSHVIISPHSPSKNRSHASTTSSHMMVTNGIPRQAVPVPFASPPRLNFSSIDKTGMDDFPSGSEEEECDQRSSSVTEYREKDSSLHIPSNLTRTDTPLTTGLCLNQVLQEQLQAETEHEERRQEALHCVRPDCYKHFIARYKASVRIKVPVSFDEVKVKQKCGKYYKMGLESLYFYTFFVFPYMFSTVLTNYEISASVLDEDSLVLKTIIGYNGNGRGNMVWNPDTGFFAYSCGCVIVVEDLHSGSQKHWLGHTEEISTLAVSNDALVLASASASDSGGSSSQIFIWNVTDGSYKKIFSHHKEDIQAMAFSRDDRFFVTAGDYRDCTIALWNTRNYELLTMTRLTNPVHDVAFNPASHGEFACVGTGPMMFWMTEEENSNFHLKVHSAPVPNELGPVELTSLCYNTNSILYTGTNTGRVCVWDTKKNCCFMTWEADQGEIGIILCQGNRLLSGSNTRKIKLWDVASVQDMRLQGSKARSHSVLLVHEMTLDGTVVSAAFDEVLDMGIVGTTAGTLWYINWAENTSIRLISGHKNKVRVFEIGKFK